MKKILLTVLALALYSVSNAFTMQVIKTNGDNSGYFDKVQMYHNGNDNHQLYCTNPGIKPCTTSEWQFSSCVTQAEADACIAYADAQVAAGNASGSYTTSSGITITWNSTSTGGMTIDISKTCN